MLFLVRGAGIGSAAVGLLLAAAACGGTCGALIARRLGGTLGTARTLLLTAVTASFGLLVPLTQAGNRVGYFLIGSIVMTAGILIGNIIVAAFRQTYCPPEMLGRVVTGMRFLAFGAGPLGALAAGGLGTAIGVRDALWCTLIASAASSLLLFTPAILTRRDLPKERARK